MARPETGAFGSPEEILLRFAAEVARHGPIQAVRLFCRSDRPEQLLCMVQMDDGASRAVTCFPRAFVTGSDLCTFVDVPVHFACEQRAEGRMRVPTCSACRQVVDGSRRAER